MMKVTEEQILHFFFPSRLTDFKQRTEPDQLAEEERLLKQGQGKGGCLLEVVTCDV